MKNMSIRSIIKDESPARFLPAITLFMASMAIPAFGAVDSEDYPIVYLRGEFGYQNWMPDDAYRFTRTGETYTLEINDKNPVTGQFKIADEDWHFDYGGQSQDIRVDESQLLELSHGGANLITNGISSGVISFNYPRSGMLTVRFEINGTKLPELGPSGSLPVMYINVYEDENHTRLNPEIIDYNLDHKDYFDYAEYWIDTNDCKWMEDLGAESIGSESEPLPLQIKARGNWTRIGFSKKPFKIKLDKKQNLLGLTPEKSKHYALLAHADDSRGYLRNFTTFNLGKRIGLPWTPGMQPVELVINGDYRGLYFLTESVRAGDGRIDIEELDDNETDPALISGGYIVELDNYDEENQIRLEEKSCAKWHFLDKLRVTWDTPEVYSDIQKRFVTDQFSAINDAIGENSNITWQYLDLDDAVRYYLVCEIVSHTESFHGSTYLYRDRGEGKKWHFSPLWDAGNAFQGHTDDYFYNCDPFGNTWIPSLRENTMFNNKLKETWLWLMQNEYPGIEDDMREFASRVSTAAKSDRQRWKNEPVPGGGQSVADNSNMENRLTEVLNVLEAKVEWLKRQWGDFNVGRHSEPARDDTAAAPLPDYAQAAVDSIMDDYDGVPEYYNLQGLKVDHPKSGEIYILKQGSKTRKILYR